MVFWFVCARLGFSLSFHSLLGFVFAVVILSFLLQLSLAFVESLCPSFIIMMFSVKGGILQM